MNFMIKRQVYMNYFSITVVVVRKDINLKKTTKLSQLPRKKEKQIAHIN